MGCNGAPGFLPGFHFFRFSPPFCFRSRVFFEALQVYNLIGLSHINAECGGRAEAAGYFMVLVHNGPLMCFLSLKVQPHRSRIRGTVLLFLQS